MKCLRSLFCCGSRASQRAAERREEDQPGGPGHALPGGVGLQDGLTADMDEGLEMLAAFRAPPAPLSQDDAQTSPPPIDEDIEDVPRLAPGGRWRTVVNCHDAGVQAAFRDGISVTLSGGLALAARAGAMLLAAKSQAAAITVGAGATVGAFGMLLYFWPHATKLILEPTSLRETAWAKWFVTALPFMALTAALAATPTEDDNTKLKIAVIALCRQLAAWMRDTCTQTQSEAWGSLDICTADGDRPTLDQTRQYQLARAAVATAVYCTMGWFILNAGDDWLGEVLKEVTDGMKADAQKDFPSPGWPVNEHGESPSQFLARTSYKFNVVDNASRFILGLVLETFDGFNSGGLAPAVAALCMGLRAKYKPGKGPAAVLANWCGPDGKAAATRQRIFNNASMRIGISMGGELATAVGYHEPLGTPWRIASRQAASILNGLTEVRSLLIERGISAGTLAELQRMAQEQANAEALSQSVQQEQELATMAAALERETQLTTPRAQAPSAQELARIEQQLHTRARQLATSRAAPTTPVETAPVTARVVVNIGLYDSVMTVLPAPVHRRPRGGGQAQAAH